MSFSQFRRALPGLLAALLLAAGAAFTGCSKPPDAWKAAREGQKHLLVTFPPLYCLAHAVAGDDAYALCFLSTTGPHEYQFNPIDAVKARGADLIISNGLGLDDTFIARLNNKSAKVPVLEAGEAIPEDLLLPMDDHDEDDHGKEEKGHHHHHGANDPHVWLGPPQAMAMADAIAKKLAEIDPPHAEGYAKRAAELKGRLRKLHEDGRERLAGKKNRKVLTMHESMSYFAKAFGLETVGSIQIRPGDDPDAARIGRLEKVCRDKGVAVVTYEPQYPRAQSELLQSQLRSRGLDVRLAEFDPLETAPLGPDGVNPAPGYYLDKMRANVDNLAKALP